MKASRIAAFGPLLALAVGLIVGGEAAAQKPSRRAQYLAYAKASADWAWSRYDETIAQWRKSFDPKNVFGYRAPGGLLEMAAIYAHFFEVEKKPDYADRAKKVLLTYGDYRSEFPDFARKARADYADGIPPLPDFFTVMRYVRAYETLHRLNRLTSAENAVCEKIISESVSYMLRTQEWGTMNRSVLRAENLASPPTPRRRGLGDAEKSSGRR
jgi:hypothetical protein